MTPAPPKRRRFLVAASVAGLSLLLLLGGAWLRRETLDARPAATVEEAVPGGRPVAAAPAPVSEAPPDAEALANEVGTRSAESEESEATPGQTMRVLVLDALEQRPLAEARVTLLDRAAPTTRRTGADGRCEVPFLDRERRSMLHVEAPGYFHARLEGTPTEFLRVALAPATELEGRVRAADSGEPIAGARLSLPHLDCLGCAPDAALTDAEGRYALPAVPVGRALELLVEAEGFAPTRRAFQVLEPNARTTQDLTLRRGAEIAGRVEDWGSGLGLSGARVGELTCDAQGSFRGRLLARGASTHARLRVEAPGHVALEVELDLTEAGPRVFRLPALAFLEGRVFGPSGASCEGARVTRTRAEPNRAPAPSAPSPLDELPEGQILSLDDEPVESDAEGRYRLPLLPWADDVGFVVDKTGLASQDGFLGRIGPPGSSMRLDWWLRGDAPGTILRGQVTLNGQVLRNPLGTVSWTGPTRSGGQGLGKEPFELWVEPGLIRLAATLPRLSGVSPGELACRLSPDETRWVELDVVAPLSSISGSVRFRDGRPARALPIFADCEVEPGLPDGDRLTARTTTDAEGRYALPVTDLGVRWRVWPIPPVGRSESREASPGARGIDFTLPDASCARLRVREGTTGAVLAPGEDVLVTWRADRASFRAWKPRVDTTDAEGWSEVWLGAPVADFAAFPLAPELARHAPALRLGAALDPEGSTSVELVLWPGIEATVEQTEDQLPWPDDRRLFLMEEELWTSALVQDESGPAGWLAEHRVLRFDEQGLARLVGLAAGPTRLASDDANLRIEPGFPELTASSPPIRLIWSQRD